MISINVSKKLLTSEGPITFSVHLEINKREFISFFGPSGAGKTTTLRMLAGLTKPDTGSIIVNGQVWFDSEKKINIPVQKRNIGFVFQDYALFPTMTVRQNLEYAAGKNSMSIGAIMETMALNTFANTYPADLSDGQCQRVALARALVRSPQILLLDEPLSALDWQLRCTLQNEIIKLHNQFNLTSVIVTHDITEIFKMTDKVAVFGNGTVLRQGTPDLVFGNRLSTRFRVIGKIVAFKTSEVASVMTVQVGDSLTQIVVDTEEAAHYKAGDEVIVAAKAFKPILLPLAKNQKL
jgi:molybdate transport system ATP-binding protein